MKVSKHWLQDFVEFEDMYELADLFSLHSQEVADTYPLTNVTNLKVGYVKSKEKHPDSDKLSLCQVDVGTETLQIVCGAPNVDADQKVIVATNGAVLPGIEIKPVTIRGVESNGMICSLVELGIDKKYADGSGIQVLSKDAPVGASPLEYLELDDTVMELDLTPNRGDLLSMMGVAYDAAAMLNKEVALPYVEITEIDEENDMEIDLQTDKCLSYYTRVIKDVVIKPSPKWMQARLIAAGMRPINNVVDITNYIMLETGQPLHAFDLEKFNSKKVVVKTAEPNELFTTLDSKERKMSTEDIMISNGSISTGIAGVMGGENTEIDEHTKYVLLESAVFHPTNIRKTSRRLDLRSDASSRFEKGLDPNRTLLALNRASQLFSELADGKILKGIKSVESQDLTPKEIKITLAEVCGSFGTALSKEEVLDLLSRYDFDTEVKDDLFIISVPTRRYDLVSKQDIIEELVRLYGYDNIPSTLPGPVMQGHLTHEQALRRTIRRALNGLGLQEALTYSLVPEKEVYTYSLYDEPYTNLMMPMSEDKSTMRISNINGLLNALKYNAARKLPEIALYEMGSKYNGNNDMLLTVAITGNHVSSEFKHQSTTVDFYYVKGILEQVLALHGVKGTYKPSVLKEVYHPGQSAEVDVDDIEIGFIARLHPKHEKELGLSETYVFEINLSNLPVSLDAVHYKAMPKYPIVNRDLAVVVKRDVLVGDLLHTVKHLGIDRLVDVTVFDHYIGENVGSDEQSIALSLKFYDETKTLESAEVEAEVTKIIEALTTEHQAKLRD